LQRSGANAPRWKVYPGFIPDGDQIVCKTYMTRVQRRIVSHFWDVAPHVGENTRLRHYLGGAGEPIGSTPPSEAWCEAPPPDRAESTALEREAKPLQSPSETMARMRRNASALHRKSLCYSKSEEMLKHSIRLLIHYLKFEDVPIPYRFLP